MSFVRNFPIARKFTYAFGIISLLCVGLACYTFITLRGIAAKASDIGVNGVPSVVDLATMRTTPTTFAGPGWRSFFARQQTAPATISRCAPIPSRKAPPPPKPTSR